MDILVACLRGFFDSDVSCEDESVDCVRDLMVLEQNLLLCVS